MRKSKRLKSKVLEETKQFLKNRPRKLSLSKIADDTGLTVDWLKQISQGRTKNPGILYVEHLHSYLSRQFIVIA